jgi:hypothetical protein
MFEEHGISSPDFTGISHCGLRGEPLTFEQAVRWTYDGFSEP